MNAWFLHALYLIQTKQVDLKNDDIRALLVMTNSTAFADSLSAQFLTGGSGIVTLDEYSGSGYARVALAGRDVVKDVTTKQCRWTVPGFSFGATISNGPRQAKGILLYKHVGADSANIPLLWIDSVNTGIVFPFDPAGGPITAAFPSNICAAQGVDEYS